FSGDIADTRVVVALFGEDPRGCGEDRVQLLVVGGTLGAHEAAAFGYLKGWEERRAAAGKPSIERSAQAIRARERASSGRDGRRRQSSFFGRPSVARCQSPVASRQSPVASRQSPVASRQSPGAGGDIQHPREGRPGVLGHRWRRPSCHGGPRLFVVVPSWAGWSGRIPAAAILLNG